MRRKVIGKVTREIRKVKSRDHQSAVIRWEDSEWLTRYQETAEPLRFRSVVRQPAARSGGGGEDAKVRRDLKWSHPSAVLLF